MTRWIPILLLFWAAGCGGGGGPGNAPPRIIAVLPGVNVTAEEGVDVLVQWLATDLDDIAVTDVFADIDGDLSTTGDQIALALGVTELNGVSQEVVWNTRGVPFGNYRVIYRTDDSINPPTVLVAPGRVNVVFNPPPTAEILFPPPNSVTDASAITVTGKSDDQTGTRIVRANGVAVSTTDKFKTWSVVVDLLPDQLNVITVETQDELANTDPAAATFFVDTRAGGAAGSGTPLLPLACVAYDDFVERIFALEAGLAPRILAAPLEDGVRTVLSGPGPALVGPGCIRFDRDGRRLFVVDTGLRAVLQVDRATGERVIISGDARGTGPNFVEPRALDYDERENVVVVLDAGLGVLVRVELATGDRTEYFNGGPAFVDPIGMAVDDLRGAYYVTDAALDAVFAVEFGGTHRIVSTLGTGSGTTFLEPGGIAVDLARNRVLVADKGRAAILGVNLFTGDRQVLSGPGDARGTLLVEPTDLVFDPNLGVLFVTDAAIPAIFAVEVVRGDRVMFAR